MELPLKIVGVVFQLQEPEHVEEVLEKAARFFPFGPGVEILGGQEDQPQIPP